MGSAPHTRGALRVGGHAGHRRGISPARAGSTGTAASFPPPSGDQSRTRGAHSGGVLGGPSSAGSAPHARGAPEPGTQPGHLGGISPARAGSTETSPIRGWVPWDSLARAGSTQRTGRQCPGTRDQPPTRGEHDRNAVAGKTAAGSAPYAQGASGVPGPPRPCPGISPARAGSTRTGTAAGLACGDQPCTGGEHRRRSRVVCRSEGSAPHARGARRPVVAGAARAGISPARAGSTRPPPAVRGGRRGSAPHVRGAR